jgi:hypothetical protein
MSSLLLAIQTIRGTLALAQVNLRGVITHIIPLYLASCVLNAVFQYRLYGNLSVMPVPYDPALLGGNSNYAAALIFGLLMINCGFYLLIATGWHRLVLRPEHIKPTVGQVFFYLWRVIQQTLLYLPIVVFFVLIAISNPDPIATENMAQGLGFTLIDLAYSLIIGWVLLRTGLILPAAAVSDDRVGFSASWRATQPWAAALWWIAALEVILWRGKLWLTDLASLWSETFGFVIDLLLYPLPFLLGLAILTYLYQKAAFDDPAGI